MSDTPDVQIDETETVNVTQSVGEPETDGDVTEITDSDSASVSENS